MFAAIATLLTTTSVKAVEEESINRPDMPAENDPYWSFMAGLNRPDSDNCTSVATGAPYNIPADQASSFCAQLAQMPTEMQAGMTQGGAETNLFSASNWHAVDNLYFQHSTNGVADGRIAFTVPIDFMSYDFMYFMMTFGQRMEAEPGILGLTADIVDGMENYGAVLTMYNVPDLEDPVVLVDGEEDNGDVVSNIVYDRGARTLTFRAAHFTTFEAVERSSLDTKPKIFKVAVKKYKTKKLKQDRVKVIIRGDKFKRDTDVELGGLKASKVLFKNDNKIVAIFSLEKLKQNGREVMKLKAINGSEEKRYKYRLQLKDML